MEPIPYLKTTSSGLFKYRRRTPKELTDYIDTKEIIKSLGKCHTEATRKSIEINQVLDEAIQLTQLSSIPKSLILTVLSSKYNLAHINNKPQENNNSLSYTVGLYLEQSQVTPLEYSNREYFFKSLLPATLKVLFNQNDMKLDSITYDKILKVRSLLLKMPNRNHVQYKAMDVIQLVSDVYKETLYIPKEHLVSTDTVNKSLKRIKSILLFAKDLGFYTGSVPKTITINKSETSARDYKAILTSDEFSTVLSSIYNDDVKYLYRVLYYTGMRRSELYKCSISAIDGILCFNLETPSEQLKTQSSYRVIPVHSKLLDKIHQYENILTIIKPDRLTKNFTKVVKSTLQDSDKKTMYSLRHTFATTLIANGVQPEVVSELMGHAHSTMTMNRYVKGYPIKVLKEAIDKL